MHLRTNTVLLLAAALPLAWAPLAGAANHPTVQLQGFPANKKLVLPKSCSGDSWNGDCTWDLSFTATVNTEEGIQSITGAVNGVQQVTSTNPGTFADCDDENGTVTTVANATFSHSFAVTCGASASNTIAFTGTDCGGDPTTESATVELLCEVCEPTDSEARTYSNGTTTVRSAPFDQPLLIQFAVMNASPLPQPVELFLEMPPDFPFTPLPEQIMLEPGQVQQLMVQVDLLSHVEPGAAITAPFAAMFPGDPDSATEAPAFLQVTCPADLDLNGVVDVNDLVRVITAWGSNDPSADTNYDGIVDVNDLVEVLTWWGECS